MKEPLNLVLWVVFVLGCLVHLIHFYAEPPYQCDCAAINTECGQPTAFSSLAEWEKTLKKKETK